jgi:YegS/Rv2252/BmrU family lipid kinase
MMNQPGAMTTVLINEAGGAAQRGNAIGQVQQLLAARLPAATSLLVRRGDDLSAQAQTACAAGAQVVVAAGGDGTVNAVAQVLVKTDVRLGVLPFGTRNHFARDIGMPTDLSAAIDLLARGTHRRIDVGAVNDRYFVNNASVGLYPELVGLREHLSHVWPKRLRLLTAMAQLAHTAKPVPVELCTADSRVKRCIWLVFVGNNRYQFGIFPPARRMQLDEARLDVIVVGARRRARIVPLMRDTLRGRVRAGHAIGISVPMVKVQMLQTHQCRIAFDGEEAAMAAPFVFRTIPRALWVVAPDAF